MLTLHNNRIEHLIRACHPGSLVSSLGLPSGLICLKFAHGSCGMEDVTTGPHRYSGHDGLDVRCATRNVLALVELHIRNILIRNIAYDNLFRFEDMHPQCPIEVGLL